MPWDAPAAAAVAPVAAGGGGGGAAVPDAKLGSFLQELDATEKADSVWTNVTQIDRLTKPGSKYLNLNPYEVLQIEPGMDPAAQKKHVRKLQFLVHPDRNRDSPELSKKAFEAVGEAKRMLEDEDKMSFINKVLDEAKEKTKFMVAEKRGQARKSGEKKILEDSPSAYIALYKKNSKMLFAEYAKRKETLENEQAEAKTKNEAAKAEAFAKRKRDSDEKEKWESGMGGRIDGWRDFKKPKKKKKGSAGLGFLKPPKLKTEKRDTTSKR
eukprot:m.417389 g.417389  ORF g.417389 m.417389 type:complete len:268 (-) comp30426_c0_seq1:204-1007(-)